MTMFFSGVGVILSLELRQRVRTLSWYILLAVFVGLILVVTVLLSVALAGFGSADDGGGGVYSTIIYFVLLLGTLVAPALSGNAINGDRDAGTLATTQVTLITTGQLIAGKFLAAWITAIAFLAAAVPFLIYAAIVGQLRASTIIVSIVVLAIELGVVAAIGVGLSGLMVRPLFSIVVTYLVVAALSVGTLIAFTLGGLALQTTTTSVSSYAIEYNADGTPSECSMPEEYENQVPRFDLFWGALVANPYVILADAVPTAYDANDQPKDLFGFFKLSVRTVQLSGTPAVSYNECVVGQIVQPPPYPSARTVIESTTPGWAVGLATHLVLAGVLLVGAWARTKTPAAKLSRGSRIA
ncbi:ABC-type transport system involved in multi-copper enzyme maturation permease subunit [Rhodoglobus vestalii]|uniref:ABC-type transport system involved in multi-copper enzyme maturation permease subunit n=1 Tax=Rhodoglobus vestalii TaxID=193384 RepID=A0A8H2K7N4_9MICO|nr:ABC transporter permease [Rhodoglobus vestalii]TQO20194.1 ABC-type transport system involved in multi-copper enzyme maturation permease subunit [Rhodoglobus vestalii]